jgi:hypothetical protein
MVMGHAAKAKKIFVEARAALDIFHVQAGFQDAIDARRLAL